jgi:hypothetical protein
LSDKADVMRTTSLGASSAALAVAVTAVLMPGPAAAQASYGGTCNVGVKHRIAKDVYPRTIYYSGGARCVSGGQPAVVFQDAQTYLYKLPNNNLVDRGDRVRGYTDWSISKGAYPGAEKTERYRLVLDVELKTPDGSPWAEFGSDDCEGEGTPVVRCHVSKTFKVS